MSGQPFEIDDDLIVRVMRRYGFASPAAAVDHALRRLVVEPLTLEQALAMRGSGWAVKPLRPAGRDRPATP